MRLTNHPIIDMRPGATLMLQLEGCLNDLVEGSTDMKRVSYFLQLRAGDIDRIPSEYWVEPGQRADAMMLCAALYGAVMAPDKAVEFYARAAALYQSLNLPAKEALGYDYLGSVHRDAQRGDEAVWSWTRALEIYEILDMPVDQANVLNYLGTVHRDAERWDQAGASFARALELYETLERASDQARVKNNLGILCREIGLWDRAAELHERALELYEVVGSVMGQANSIQLLGALSLARGDVLGSRVLFDRAVRLYESKQDFDAAALAAVSRARAVFKLFRERAPLTDCLTLLIPAAVFLDSGKFRYRTTEDRVRTSVESGKAFALALEIACVSRHSELVADLVETQINSIVHAAGAPGKSYVRPRRAAIRNAMTEQHKIAEISDKGFSSHGKRDKPTHAMLAAGTVGLLSTSSLPGLPPPHLIAPSDTGDRLVLHSWLRSWPYPATKRAAAAVRIW